MQELKLNITSENGLVKILTGNALDFKEKDPLKVNLSGTIDSPFAYLEKRKGEIDLKKCYLVINRKDMKILLVVNESDQLNIATIIGKLEMHPDFEKFAINTGNTWSSFELAELIKMNRSFFSSKETAAKLVSQLRDFKAKVDKVVENFKDDKANFNIKRAQAVETNLPPDFNITIPVFKGQLKQNISVEINIHPESLACTLCSPDANDSINEYRESVIDTEKSKIMALVPELLIIEQ